MRKTIATLITAAALAAPFAQAEEKVVTASLAYDSALLSSEAGAKIVLASLRKQATEVCAYRKPVTGSVSFDRACRDDLVEKAITQIRLAAIENGQATTYVFASAEADADALNQ